MLYNCRRIFFILSFFIGYILSFGLVRLRTIQLSAHAGAHIECSSCSHAEDVTIANVIIKTPDRKCDWGVNDVIPRSEGLRILVIFEKAVSWDLSLGEASWDLKLGEARRGESSLWATGCTRVCWVSELRFWLWAERSAGELTEGRCRNSHHSKNCVSLSSCRKTKTQEVNKHFAPEQRVSSVFQDFYACENFTYLYHVYITHKWETCKIKWWCLNI